MRLATFRINTYFAMLILTIAAGAATLIIVHVGTTTYASFTHGDRDREYTQLRESILKDR